MLTDRKRVELALLPMLMMDVLINGVDDPASDEAKRTHSLLWVAVKEVVNDLGMKQRSKIMRRTERAHEAILAQYKNAEASVDKVGLLVFYVLQAVTDCDYLVLAAGSPMSEAMDLMLPMLAPSAEIEKLNASAKKGARRALKTLQDMGYFEGVEMATQNS